MEIAEIFELLQIVNLYWKYSQEEFALKPKYFKLYAFIDFSVIGSSSNSEEFEIIPVKVELKSSKYQIHGGTDV